MCSLRPPLSENRGAPRVPCKGLVLRFRAWGLGCFFKEFCISTRDIKKVIIIARLRFSGLLCRALKVTTKRDATSALVYGP